MRFSPLLAGGLAATAVAKPMHNHKRAYVTDITYVTITVYVTPGQEPLPTPTPSVMAAGYQPHSHSHKAKVSTTTTSVYVAAASTPVYVAPSSSTPTPVKSSAAAYTPSSSPAPVYSAAPVSSAAPVPSQVQSSAAPAATGYEATVLRHHNIHRSNHSASDLVWNQTLADAAYSWASQCKFEHHVDGYGQNLAASLPNANVTAQITNGWYNGEMGFFEPYYDIASPAVTDEIFESYGHFTQMVWKGSQSLGCATYDCRGASGDFKMWYTVCNYYPAGNWAGEYAANVGRPKGNPTCNWDA